jgi:alpha-beta hydrolase superfamily lysophospholipase
MTSHKRNPAISEFRFTSSDGLGIACVRWANRGPLRGVVQIAHGMGEHIGRYRETIEALTSAGLAVYGNDHRGHGRSAFPTGNLGDFGAGGFDLLVEDMVRLSHIIREEHPHAPLFLLGHSMGSFAAQQFVLDRSHEIDGLILSGSGVLDGLVRVVRLGASRLDVLNDDFDPARTPFDWLSRDDAIVDAFIGDPRCFPELKPAALASFLAAAPMLSDPLYLQRIREDLPIYVFSGSEDPVGQELVGVQALIERYHEAGINNIAHDFYPGGRHEMLNEVNRAEVRTRLLGWISSVLGAPAKRVVTDAFALNSYAH